MKRSEIFFDIILVPLDFFAILAAGIITYIIRVSPALRSIRPVLFSIDLSLREYIGLVVVVALITLIIFAFLGLYSMGSTRGGFEEFTRISAGGTLSVATIIGWMFFRSELFQSRFILVAAWVISIIFVTLIRRFVRLAQIRLFERGIGTHLVVLIEVTTFPSNLKKHSKRTRELVTKLLVSSHV
jgi:FlaA1/EpsC-like NDP-sugar epimerase